MQRIAIRGLLQSWPDVLALPFAIGLVIALVYGRGFNGAHTLAKAARPNQVTRGVTVTAIRKESARDSRVAIGAFISRNADSHIHASQLAHGRGFQFQEDGVNQYSPCHTQGVYALTYGQVLTWPLQALLNYCDTDNHNSFAMSVLFGYPILIL